MIEYSRITIDDLHMVTDMYETYLNSGKFMEAHIREGIESPYFVGYKAMENGRMVGMMTGRGGLDFTYPHPELEAMIQKRFRGEQIYSPDSLTVIDDYRGTDVGFKLGHMVLEEIYKKGYRLLVSELWIYPDGHVPADHILRNWGTVVYEENIELFYKDLYKYKMKCPICGAHCTCGAKILIVKISEESIRNNRYIKENREI